MKILPKWLILCLLASSTILANVSGIQLRSSELSPSPVISQALNYKSQSNNDQNLLLTNNQRKSSYFASNPKTVTSSPEESQPDLFYFHSRPYHSQSKDRNDNFLEVGDKRPKMSLSKATEVLGAGKTNILLDKTLRSVQNHFKDKGLFATDKKEVNNVDEGFTGKTDTDRGMKNIVNLAQKVKEETRAGVDEEDSDKNEIDETIDQILPVPVPVIAGAGQGFTPPVDPEPIVDEALEDNFNETDEETTDETD